MQKVEHNLSTGRVDVLEMKPEEITAREQAIAAYRAAQEAEAAKPTPAKTLLAAAQAAKSFEELQPVVVALIELVFSLSATVGELPVEEQP